MSSCGLEKTHGARALLPLLPFLLLSLFLFPSCGSEAGTEQTGPAVVEEEEGIPEERATQPSLSPEDPGKSGVLGPQDGEDSSASFAVRRGKVRALPAAMVAKEGTLAEVDRRGVLSVYGDSGGGPGTPRWERPGVLPLLSLGAESVVVAVERGVVALGLQAGEELWRVSLESEPVDLRARRETVLVAAGRSLLWIASETGRVTGRRNLAAPATELLLAAEMVYAVTANGVEAYGRDQELRWRFDSPGLLRGSLSGGEEPVLLLESEGGFAGISGEEGELLWDLPGERLSLRPVLLKDRFFLPREEGVLEARSTATAELLWSEGVAPGIAGRPRFWQGRIWVPSGDGSLLSVSSQGELLGFLETGPEEIAFLYGNEERLGAIDQFGSYLEIGAEGSDLRLSLPSGEDGGAFEFPSLGPGEGPVLFALKSEPVTLPVEQESSGIYLFRLPLQGRTATIVDLIDEGGSVLGSNLDKIELAETLRIRLEGDESYRIEARPARDDLVGSLTAVSLQLLREER